LHGFDGRVVADALAPADPEMMSFHPSGESAAIAHGGMSIWDFASGKTRRVGETGRNVEWSPDGRALWFTERDSELWTLDLASGRATRVLKLEGDAAGCTNFTNRLRWTPDGKHLLAQMSRKAAVSPGEEARRRKAEPHGWETGQSFDFDHYFCVLEPGARRLWLAPGYSHQVAWAAGL
jgi:dipeptidyl aminopeptidase/acylaminoacyl peptidase